MIGRTIGNYVVRAKVGEGGMGVVYKAEHPQINRRVAIKVLHPGVDRNAEAVHRFFNEAKAATNIRDEHIVEVLDFGALGDGAPYLVMEWLEGTSLGDILRAEPRQPVARTAGIVHGIALALKAAHAKGVIHRDLKPDNVFLVERHGASDFIKVLDFGIAKLIQTSDMNSYQTQTGALVGTPAYMSPEQCRGAKDIDTRTDVYSLGVIAYQMLTGRLPFVADALGELLFKHLTERPEPAATLQPEVPESVSAIISGALEKEPDDRPSLEQLTAVMAEVWSPVWPKGSLSGTLSLPMAVSGAVSREPHFVSGNRPVSMPVPAATLPRPVSSTTLGAAASQLDSQRRLPGRWSGRLVAALVLAGAGLAAGLFLLARTQTLEPRGDSAASVAIAPAGAANPARVPEPVAVRSPVRVEIRTDPGGARLEVDGLQVENPFLYTGREPSGRLHEVSVRMPGFVSLRQSLAFDRDRQLVLKLAPEPVASGMAADDTAQGPKTAPAVAPTGSSSGAFREPRIRKGKTAAIAGAGAASAGDPVPVGTPGAGYRGSKLKIETDFP